MVLTRKLLALLLLISATLLAENTAPAAVHSALRVSLPASPAYHTSTKATRVTAHSKSRLVATRAARRRSRFRRIVWNPLLKASHLSGLTVDLAKRGLTKKQHTWLERYLADLKSANVLEPAEERRQACFHVMIFERYTQWREGTLAQNTTEPAAEPSPQPEPQQPPR